MKVSETWSVHAILVDSRDSPGRSVGIVAGPDVVHSKHQLSEDEVLRLAQRQLSDYDARSPGALFSGRSTSLDEVDGYRIQLATAKLRRDRGEPVAGYKIGCVSETIRRQLGVEHAVFGHVYGSEIRTSPASLGTGEFCRLGIEGEFAVTLSEDVDDPAQLAEEPSRFVASVLPVMELHNYVFRGPKPYAGELIANNALNAGIVVPAMEPERVPRGPMTIRVSIADRIDDTARVDPLESLPELTKRLAAFGIRSHKGDILLTGSPLPLYLVEAGELITVRCDGAADVSAFIRPD